MKSSKPKYIHIPSRSDQRSARQILAGLLSERGLNKVARIGDGPLTGVIRFLAACRGLSCIISGLDAKQGWFAAGTPSKEKVVQLCRAVLGEERNNKIVNESDSASGLCFEANCSRKESIEYAMDCIVERLLIRDDLLFFVIAWGIDGSDFAKLEHTCHGLRCTPHSLIRSFLTERLGELPDES